MKCLKWIGVIYGLTVFSALAASEVYVRDFWAPRMDGQRLAYCLVDNHHCGQLVADRYCRLQGYDGSKRIIKDHNIGMAHYLDSKKDCLGWACSGFKLLQCTAQTLHQPPRAYYFRSQRFVVPRFNHFRVDWCYANGKECGARPAFSFCRRMGFRRAIDFKQESNLGATRALGNLRLCFGGDCHGFSEITCKR